VDGDCCSSACTAEADGGTCDDGETCTQNDQCAAGVCVGTAVTDGTTCDDGDVCTTDGCQGGACVGVPTPVVGCKVPTLPARSQLVLKDKTPDDGDQVLWKWTKGQATAFDDFGSPDIGDDYHLCTYDATPSVVFSATFPAGGTCAGTACWRIAGTSGFAYKDKDRTPDGMEKLLLKSGTAGAAKIQAKGKGINLRMPALGALQLPLIAQLRGPGGECWEATYSTPVVATTTLFRAKSD
jgi:hypothetical protein